jgi:tRNA threonylcarbamoyladenosine biosynthesis protein TsaB
MLVLGIETATAACTVGLVENDELLAELTLHVPRAHSVRLMPLIAQAFAEAGKTPADLAGVAVGVGPGSFTGLRIGLATAKALAWSQGVPTLAVDTLGTLAAGVAPLPGLVLTLLDAKRDDVFGALYRTGPGGVTTLVAPALAPISQAQDWVREHGRPGEALLLAGDAATLHAGRTGWPVAPQVLPAEQRLPRGGVVARLGLALLRAGRTTDPVQLAPVYLRPSAAEARRAGGSEA